MRIILFLDPHKHLPEILERHIRMDRRHPAITAAMTAVHIASESRLPEQLSQRMGLLPLLEQLSVKFQRNALPD